MFAVRYAEFHQRLLNRDLQDAAWDLVSMFQEDMAPKSWWAVLLCDAVELLQYGELLAIPVNGAAKVISHENLPRYFRMAARACYFSD